MRTEAIGVWGLGEDVADPESELEVQRFACEEAHAPSWPPRDASSADSDAVRPLLADAMQQ